MATQSIEAGPVQATADAQEGQCAIFFLSEYPPSVNNLRTVSRGRIISSAMYRAWKTAQAWFVKSQREPKVPGFYSVHVMVNKPDNRLRDITNLLKSIEDAFVEGGMVDDDRYCQKATIEWVRGMNTPVKVFITSTGER